MSTNFQKLKSEVISSSESNDWYSAVDEWSIGDCYINDMLDSECICGKEHIKYEFSIVNDYNGNILYPIGSSCIKRFDREDLSELVNVHEQMSRLLEAVEAGEYIEINSDYFSRKLLGFLYEEGAFMPNKYNSFNPRNDYLFLLDVFNSRDKSWINSNVQRKINAIIVNSIRPYLKGKIKLITH